MSVMAIDHVQLAMPAGREADARAFAGLLGFVEWQKPATLAGRGGAWFAAGAARLHYGVAQAFTPARKAHPAFLVRELATMIQRLEAAGCHIVRDVPLPGYIRVHVFDPFGNRIELMETLDA